MGRRHAATPAVLEIDAAEMPTDRLNIAKRGVETYTTDGVPPKYLAVREQ